MPACGKNNFLWSQNDVFMIPFFLVSEIPFF